MASLSKPKPPSSRWGFLSQAVASVESRLDTILADDDEPVTQNGAAITCTKENGPVSRSSQESTRSATTTQANDRLQERLARAMVKKSGGMSETPTGGSESVSRPSTPAVQNKTKVAPHSPGQPSDYSTPQKKPVTDVTSTPMNDTDTSDAVSEPQTVQEKRYSGVEDNRSSIVATLHDTGLQEDSTLTDPPITSADHTLPAIDSDASSKYEEIQSYVERIDALNAKLQYLANEAIQSARDTNAAAENGSPEQRLAAKDGKIAALIEEGNKLSVAEMKNLAVIKKMRVQNTALVKEQNTIKTRLVSTEKQVSLVTEQAKKAEHEAQTLRDQISTSVRVNNELDTAKKERNKLQATVSYLKSQIALANERAERAEVKAQDDKLELGRLRTAELENDIAKSKSLLEGAERNFTQQIEGLRKALDQEKEHGRAMESEMLAEQATLEGRLESFRIKAEEASSADHLDAHARLMRQIEGLQGQYATASQNWQGIEGTLVARITALEQDRDEVTARETDVRRRLREMTLKFKAAQKQIDDLQSKSVKSIEGPSEEQVEIARLMSQIKKLEQVITSIQKEAESQKNRLERDLARRLDEERVRLVQPSSSQSRLESPSNNSRKPSVFAIDQPMSPTHASPSRRSSALPFIMPDAPIRYSSPSVKGLTNSAAPETPSIMASPDEDYFDNVPATPISQERQQRRRGLDDVVSTSTIGGGVSVQLVERMSANVRRLESEKAASRDEITRITNQRDEARQEVVQLMRDLEQRTQTGARLDELENQYAGLSTRHQTTLELLGEKSEQVEELKQDIADVKQMYRDLADHMK